MNTIKHLLQKQETIDQEQKHSSRAQAPWLW